MKKIMFNDHYGLTRAVVNGEKTMTRRLERELKHLVAKYEIHYEGPFRVVEQRWDKNKNCLLINAHTGIADTDREHVLTLNTRYKLGEVVAVAQAYKDVFSDNDLAIFDDGLEIKLSKGWNNKLFVKPDLMPHQIQITGVRIERLQDITDEDCIKEGIYVNPNPPIWREYDPYEPWPPYVNPYKITTIIGFCKPQFAFAYLIDCPGVGRNGLWESNPWVVVYNFVLNKESLL